MTIKCTTKDKNGNVVATEPRITVAYRDMSLDGLAYLASCFYDLPFVAFLSKEQQDRRMNMALTDGTVQDFVEYMNERLDLDIRVYLHEGVVYFMGCAHGSLPTGSFMEDLPLLPGSMSVNMLELGTYFAKSMHKSCLFRHSWEFGPENAAVLEFSGGKGLQYFFDTLKMEVSRLRIDRFEDTYEFWRDPLPVFAMKDWKENPQLLDGLQLNQRVDMNIIEELAGNVPPLLYNGRELLTGEPTTHINGTPYYTWFKRYDDYFVYKGLRKEKA